MYYKISKWNWDLYWNWIEKNGIDLIWNWKKISIPFADFIINYIIFLFNSNINLNSIRWFYNQFHFSLQFQIMSIPFTDFTINSILLFQFQNNVNINLNSIIFYSIPLDQYKSLFHLLRLYNQFNFFFFNLKNKVNSNINLNSICWFYNQFHFF